MSITEKQDKYIHALADDVLYRDAYLESHGVDKLGILSSLFCKKGIRDIDWIDAGVLIAVLEAAKSAQYKADLKREAARKDKGE
ncbi:MAG: hypothetical protein C4574_00575 [Candidatus Latescibacterota bacterium]|jgi:hypothetical protein|nr:MAG: hypothetical protein C4574_00575 [Candidatus Latescibacterota bacterium]